MTVINVSFLVDCVKNENFWCGDEAINHLSNEYGVCIELYKDGYTKPYTYQPTQTKSKSLVRLYLHNKHYWSVKTKLFR